MNGILLFFVLIGLSLFAVSLYNYIEYGSIFGDGMPRKIQVVITRNHVMDSLGYSDNYHCPLAIATREVIPGPTIDVRTRSVFINGTQYRFDYDKWNILIMLDLEARRTMQVNLTLTKA